MGNQLMRAYIDIETTGFSSRNNVPTIVGILVGNEFKQFVLGTDLTGENIDDFLRSRGVKTAVGYNIIKFDIPFLKGSYCTRCKYFNSIEIDDLMIKCHSHLINGGLKETEKILGIERKREPLNFYQQMALWKRWIQDADIDALSRYLFYNEEDVRNLKLVEMRLPEFLQERFEKNQKSIETMKKKKY